MSEPTRQGPTTHPSPPSASPHSGAGADRPAPVLAGVAADAAVRLGVDPVVVRLALLVLTTAGGAGVLLYALLWLRLVRDHDPPPSPAAPADTAGQVGLAMGFAGLLLLLRTLGLWAGDAVVVPVMLGAAGSLLIWTRTGSRDRARLLGAARLPAPLRRALDDAGRGISGRIATYGPTASPARLVGGIVLVVVAMLALLAANDALVAVRELGVALVAAAIGIGLLFGPWALRLVDAVGAERRARIREEERGEMAAHLHDSVLQTLALIQRAGDDAPRMVTLARRQERELRRWLLTGRAATDASTLSGALGAMVEAIEEEHAIAVELVRVGDAPLTPPLAALVAAAREAVGNAARHAGVDTVAVFVEVSADEVVAYVRDRGRGFDVDAVADDRSGVRHSIRGRLVRRGGRATLRSAPGEGCEWELAVPSGVDDDGEGRDGR
jgi:signal transduction histidine kinase/phage shock protein PspC (stress-responsive transcriptional regulator)